MVEVERSIDTTKQNTSCYSGRHLAFRSGGPGFEFWLCRVEGESLGKALYTYCHHARVMCHLKSSLPLTPVRV